MAAPTTSLPLPDFRRQVLAVNNVAQLLNQVTAALDAAAVPYAVVGGNAVAAWVTTVDAGAVRSTKDVDVLMRRDDYARASAALTPLGLMPVEVLGVTMFVDRVNPNPRTGVHVVFAGERVRAHYSTAPPDPGESVRTAEGFAVVALAPLIAMKLQAFRDIDRVHLRDLRDVGLITPALLAGLPTELAERFESIRD